METSRALVRLGDMAKREALPWAASLFNHAKRGLRSLSGAFVDPEIADRLRQVSRELGPQGVDPFGWDPEYAKHAVGVAAFLQRSYFRTVVQGIANVPGGRVLLVANHSGQVPL